MTDSTPAVVRTALARRLMTSSGARSNAAEGLRDLRRQRADAAEALRAARPPAPAVPGGSR